MDAHFEAAASPGFGLVECRICYLFGEPQKLTPCGHVLCKGCVAKLDQLSNAYNCPRRCPFCRHDFELRHNPASLADLCIGRMQWRLPTTGLRDLPPEIRGRILTRLKNRRLLYGSKLVELLHGLSLDILDLEDASNMTPEDCGMVAQILATPPRAIRVANVSLLSDEGMKALLSRAAPVLEELNTSSAQERFSGSSLQTFANALPRLMRLTLADCVHVEPEAVAAIVAGCAETLEYIDLGGCRRMDNTAIRSLTRCCHLRNINLRGLWKLDSGPVVEVLAACRGILALDLTHCSRVSGPEIFKALAAYSTELRDLRVGGVQDVEDESVAALAMSTAGASLLCVSISRSDMTPLSLKALQEHCPVLQRLDIADCHLITENSLMEFVFQMPQLRVCQVKYCRSVSTQMQLYLSQLVAGRSFGIDSSPMKRLGGSSPSSPGSSPSRGHHSPKEKDNDWNGRSLASGSPASSSSSASTAAASSSPTSTAASSTRSLTSHSFASSSSLLLRSVVHSPSDLPLERPAVRSSSKGFVNNSSNNNNKNNRNNNNNNNNRGGASSPQGASHSGSAAETRTNRSTLSQTAELALQRRSPWP
ncbi:unnamed protein product [Polarella glacialis]|uniref:RING-type domain-containing protein n=1 Tax=Polarella glacialis TaxID=89957 RepID=A0A813H1P8_POLGL|nr:unnamed protein product [Polarella glacialis]